jgi:voltage-gated potassium channel
MSSERLTRWEDSTRWPLVAVALVFLAAYAWPILDPDLSPAWVQACDTTTWVVWGLFALDYLVRLGLAQDRRAWFVRHVFDLVVIALPLLRGFQLLRLVVLLRAFNQSAATTLRGKVGLYVGAGSALLAFVAALAALDAERNQPGATITTFADAIWWACTTMTTVGYGDTYPVTGAGRWIGVSLMLGGIALLGTVTATLASWLVDAVTEDAAEETEDSLEVLRGEVHALREELRLSREG